MSIIIAGGPDIDALSDGGFCEMGTYPGIVVPEAATSTLSRNAIRTSENASHYGILKRS